MIEIIEVKGEEEASKLKSKYIEDLKTPIDGFWQNVEVASSKCYEILYNGKEAGHFCVNSHKILVQFYVSKKYYINVKKFLNILLQVRW